MSRWYMVSLDPTKQKIIPGIWPSSRFPSNGNLPVKASNEAMAIHEVSDETGINGPMLKARPATRWEMWRTPKRQKTVYKVYFFPGFNPNPIQSRFFYVALLRGLWRRGGGICEMRIIREMDNRHWVY
jgi:hypothetical protein